MTLNTSHELSFEFLTLCIQEFEEAALNKHTRPALLAIANGTTYAMDVVLDAQERTLNRVSDTRKRLGKKKEDPDEQDEREPLQLVDEDIDLTELFGGSDSPVAKYLEECIGCSLRLKFDWQIKPLDLLNPINGFLDTIERAINGILERINPWSILEDLCFALDHLKTLCPQDIILVLLSLKMLLKRYLMQMFNIKLDWTVILGPLLNALVSALADLLDNIFALLTAPLDCALTGMKSANDLVKATEDLIGSFQSSGQQVKGFFDQLNKGGAIEDEEASGILYKDVSWSKPDPAAKADPLAFFNNGMVGDNVGYDPGHLEVEEVIDPDLTKKPEDVLRIPAGFQLRADMTMLDALADPNFKHSTALEKLIIPVQEAITWLKATFQKFIEALESLKSLVGGGLGLALENLGVLLFLEDMISIVLMIYNLLKSNKDVKDWCSFLGQNPELLAQNLKERFGEIEISARTVDNETTELVLKQGPAVVGTIKTCVNSRTQIENTNIGQWISELTTRGGM